jgi:ribosomal protein S18 acetylase RimI-like enzyme
MRYVPEHRSHIADLLVAIGWEVRYVDGQLGSIDSMARDEENARVFVASLDDVFGGFVTVEFYAWNRLAQLHGLAVNPNLRRHGIAATLVAAAEQFVREKGGRGVYVDTPVTNTGARDFYLAQGYVQDYIMTAYYADDLHGVTYLKRFTGGS